MGIVDARDILAFNDAIHDAVSGKVVSTLTSRAASWSTAVIVDANTGGVGAGTPEAITREAFFEAQKTTLNFESADLETIFNNHQGDYAAMETQSPGSGFAALESYRNALATVAQEAKQRQIDATLSSWLTFMAKLSMGVEADEDGAGTDLGGPGGIATAKNDGWAKGLLVLDMYWADMSIEKAHVEGINDQLLAQLASRRIKNLKMPMLVRGSVNTTEGSIMEAGELRFGQNEQGDVWATHIEQMDGDPDRPVARLVRRINRGWVRESSIGSSKNKVPALTNDERDAAAWTFFEDILANKKLGAIT